MLIAKSMHIAFDAEDLSLLCFCNSSIAFIPIGVAAFASPKALAVKVIAISPIAGESSGISLNSLLVTGLINLAINLIIPLLSAIFIIPSQNAIIPISEKATFTDNSAPVRIELTTSVSLPFVAPKMIDITIKK